MKKAIVIVLMIIMTISATSIAYADTASTTLYKLTPAKECKTVGRFVVFEKEANTPIDIKTMEREDYMGYFGSQMYVELPNDIVLKPYGVEIEKVNPKSIKRNIRTQLTDGVYLVNTDLKPGRYKLVGDGIAFTLSGVPADINPAITDSKSIEGVEYITIKSSDYAVMLLGVKATRVE